MSTADGSAQTVKEWQDFLGSLSLSKVRIPYAEQLAEHFPVERVRSRRDFPKLLGLIEVSAFLHQKHRNTQGEVIVASADDYRLARRLFEHSYLAGPEAEIQELLTAAEKLTNEKGSFRVPDIMESNNWGKTKSYALVARAEELGCVGETEERGRYKLIRSSAVPPLDLPEEINGD